MLVVIGLLIAFVLVAIYADPGRRGCRWRARRRDDTREARKYVCAACGAVAYTTDGKPPRECLRRQDSDRKRKE